MRSVTACSRSTKRATRIRAASASRAVTSSRRRDARRRPTRRPLTAEPAVSTRGKASDARDRVGVVTGGANVLDSPLLAFRHLPGQSRFPPVLAGAVVTTGTLTDLPPAAAGEV